MQQPAERSTMEIQELITFVSVTMHESFSKAAESLGYSQAAVTVQIRNLETELGIRLFDRLGRKIRLTAAGQIFYDHAVNVLNELNAARESVSPERELHGFLRIGTIDSLCSALFAELLHSYYLRYPDVSVSITTDSPASLLELLANGELDLVYLMDERLNDRHFTTVLEEEEPVVFMTTCSNPLADGEAHTIDDVCRYPIFLTERDASYRKVLEKKITSHMHTLHPVMESNNTDLLISLVLLNGGVTFLPEFFLTKRQIGGILKKINVPDCSVSVHRQVIHHKDKYVTAEMKAFFSLLKETGSDIHA